MKRRHFIAGGVCATASLAALAWRRWDPTSVSGAADPTSTGTTSGRRGTSNQTSATGAPAKPRTPLLGGLIEAPAGFQAVILQQMGNTFSDGCFMGAQPDGMCCHDNGKGQWVLLRNHELSTTSWAKKHGLPKQKLHWSLPAEKEAAKKRRLSSSSDSPQTEHAFGGVSRLVLDAKTLRESLTGNTKATPVIWSNAVLAGTDLNCAGGPYAWGSERGWISCEESDDENRGWAYRTRVGDASLTDRNQRRIRSWGRLRREAVVQHPGGSFYMTEDHPQGLLYRFVPRDPQKPFGEGRLEALAVKEIAHFDPSLQRKAPLDVASEWTCQWIPIDDPTAATTTCREQGRANGASPFNRNEGIVYDPATDDLVFISSVGGPQQAGQIFRYNVGKNKLTLWTQVEDRSVLSMPDNIVRAPWGGFVMAEDNYNGRGITHQCLRGITPAGEVYDILRHRIPGMMPQQPPGAEFAGCCFSPDGEVLFVNLQSPVNATLAIRGNWKSITPVS